MMVMVMGDENSTAPAASAFNGAPQSSEFEFDFDFLNFRDVEHDEAPVSPRLICPVSPWRSTPTSPAPQNPNFVSEPRNPSFGSELRNPSFRAGSRNLNFKSSSGDVSFGSEISRNPNSASSASAWLSSSSELGTSSMRQLLEEDMRSSSSSRDSMHREGMEEGDGFFFYSGPVHGGVAMDQKELSISSSSASASASASASFLGLQEGRRSMDIIAVEKDGRPIRAASGSGSVARRASFSNLHHHESTRLIHTKKPSASASSPSTGKLWAFKDFLRRTVPSSKYEADHHTRPPRRCLGESKTAPGTPRSPRPTSPKPSPLPNHVAQQQHPSLVSKPKAPVSHIEVPAPAPYKMLPSPTSASPRTPKSSKVPMSPHALHYTQQRAHAAHLKRKTNLPYRYNLLGGCLGNAFMSEHEANLVW